MISIKIQNIDQLMRAYGNVGNIVKKEMKDALDKSAAVVERAAKHKVPVDTGHLKRSIQKPKKPKAGDRQVLVGSDVKYALAVHKNKYARHRVGESEYLEKALKENEKKIIRFFKTMINNILNKLAKYK